MLKRTSNPLNIKNAYGNISVLFLRRISLGIKVLLYKNVIDFLSRMSYNVEYETVHFETISQGGAKVCKEKFSEI